MDVGKTRSALGSTALRMRRVPVFELARPLEKNASTPYSMARIDHERSTSREKLAASDVGDSSARSHSANPTQEPL